MYSESDIDAAVSGGAIDAAAALRLRDFVAENRAAPAADEESFRLVTGFNDIFVAIAATLLLVAVAWIGGDIAAPLGGFGVAAVAWGLAEYFTGRRRMALPSILLLLAFIGGLFAGMTALFYDSGVGLAIGGGVDPARVRTAAVIVAISGAVATAGALLHWRRFHVPITVAAGAGGAAALAIGIVLAAVPTAANHVLPLAFVTGLLVFALAMRWDVSDPERTTRRSDVAFWLHLLAAPMIVHPIFTGLGLLGREAPGGAAGIVLLLYVALGCVALAIDRRALMVSALAYVLYAVSDVFRQFGAVGLNVAFTALVIGSALLLLSAFWHVARGFVVARLPEGVARRLPAVRDFTPRPAS